MKKKVAINGFGRIGRLVFRHFMACDNVDVLAVNDIAPLDNLVYLLNHDSIHKPPEIPYDFSGSFLLHQDKKIECLNVKNPAELPWKDMEIDFAIESTGIFTKKNDASKHLDAGAQYVIITAPGKNADITICMGVNEDEFEPQKHKVISNASCTTNCLAPVAKVLDDKFGLVSGFLTTVHAYTSSQSIVDAPSKKWRRGRAAAVNIVPTTTGAAIATTQVLPRLKGKMDGLAIRVPVVDGSIIDFVVTTDKPVTVDTVNSAFREAADSSRLKGILAITDKELVSSDIIGMTYSAMIDAQSTMVIKDNIVKVLAWYDNEWGYARRVVDLTEYISSKID